MPLFRLTYPYVEIRDDRSEDDDEQLDVLLPVTPLTIVRIDSQSSFNCVTYILRILRIV
jgi:hypothetical protein